VVGRITVIRGQRVMLDADLAELYGAETRRLNEQVRRNRAKFPSDFIFQLTDDEFKNLKSQFATSSWGGTRKLPFVFTEHGAIMAATVLNSPRAVEMSVFVVRAFVQFRGILTTHKELAAKFEELEQRVSQHDQALFELMQAIKSLMTPPAPKKRSIGFTANIEGDGK